MIGNSLVSEEDLLLKMRIGVAFFGKSSLWKIIAI